MQLWGLANPDCVGGQQAWRLTGVDATVLGPIFFSREPPGFLLRRSADWTGRTDIPQVISFT